MGEDDVLQEAERFLRGLRPPDIIYHDARYIDADIGDWVAVSTFGAAEELTGENDEPEPSPIRLRVGSEEGDETEAYLSIEEAKAVINALRRAIRRAQQFPQPGTPWPPAP